MPPSPVPPSLPTVALSPNSTPLQSAHQRRLLLVTVDLALLFLAWEAAGGDRWMADLAGNASGFALREHWLLAGVMHGVGRVVAWVLAAALCLGIWLPLGPLRLLTRAQRAQLAGGVLLCVAAVALLKAASPAACPWSLTAYGGVVEPVSHWRWWRGSLGGHGGCFPAGHASAGFAFIGGYFVFRDVAPALARRWLLAALAAGLVLGLSQQWRGAHFTSHTLWSGWLCWCLSWALDGLRQRLAPVPATKAAAA
jgi:membrane-associated PAP2 superfamily phosphatase